MSEIWNQFDFQTYIASGYEFLIKTVSTNSPLKSLEDYNSNYEISCRYVSGIPMHF